MTLEEELEQQADDLERCVELLKSYIRVVRGEIADTTDCGLWTIFCTNLEQATNTKIIRKGQYEGYVEDHDSYDVGCPCCGI